MAISSFSDTYNLVVDFETGGRGADTLILSAGLASWSLEGAQIEGYWLIDFEDQPGRTMRGDTMAWWMKTALANPEAARSTFLDEPRFKLRHVLTAIANRVRFCPREYTIWSKPQDFDLPILEHAWEQLDLSKEFDGDKEPGQNREMTKYRCRHNARSLWGAAAVFEPDFQEEKPRVPHRADEDALAVALTCSRALRILHQAKNLQRQ